MANSEASAPKKIRLFIAINLPEAIKNALDGCRRKLASELDDRSVRWTRSEQVHITLKFIGYVADDSVPKIAQALTDACQGAPPLHLSAAGLGCFPRVRSPRVLWVGICGDTAPLVALQKRVDASTTKWTEPEKREFTPHLTLARLKEPRPKDVRTIAQFIEANKAAQFGGWEARQVDLMQSVLSPTGATYRCVASAALQ